MLRLALNLRKRSTRAVLLGLLLGIAPVALAVTWTYYYHAAPIATSEHPNASSFKAYKSETITFNSENKDRDKKVDDAQYPHTEFYDASSADYEQHWEITGEASFSSSSSVKTKDISGLLSGNVYVYVDSTFAAEDTITVEMVLDDDSTNSPGSDNDGDSARSNTWTITFKDKCPTSLECVDPEDCAAEQADDAHYTYRGNPDLDPPGRPDYEGISIHEELGSITSNIDKDVHVTEAGRTAHPTWTNNAWRDYFFGGPSSNSSFVLNGSDEFGDVHSGMWGTSTYLVLPPTADLYTDQPQTYKCNSDAGNLTHSHTIRATIKTTNVLTFRIY
jgi:hypothetical protein